MTAKNCLWFVSFVCLTGCSVSVATGGREVAASFSLSSYYTRRVHFPDEVVVQLVGFSKEADAMRIEKEGEFLILEGRKDNSIFEGEQKWHLSLGDRTKSIRVLPFALYTNRFGKEFTDLYGERWKFVESRTESDKTWSVPESPPAPYPSDLLRPVGTAFFNHEDGKLYFVEEAQNGNAKRLWVCTTF